ncbi:MAG TPA: hypothetical protein VKA34_16540 [Balneolales bacterium]|nr:hypothetical protein [Balneolales bacterium]
MITDLELVHFIPGRIRLKDPSFKKNDEIRDKVESYRKYIPVIQTVTINTLTGSLLITYDHTKRKEITSLLQKARFFGYLPGQFDTGLITDILCGDVAPEELISKNGMRDVLSKQLFYNLTDMESSTEYVREMTTSVLWYIGLRALTVSVVYPVYPLVDYAWVGYSTLSALSRVKRPGFSLSNIAPATHTN